MSKKQEFEVENLTLTSLCVWLTENKKKKTNTPFTPQDTQLYIKRGYLPKYMGGNIIDRVKGINSVKLYNICKNEITN